MSILNKIVEANAAELAARKKAFPAALLQKEIAFIPQMPSFAKALQAKHAAGRPAIIAELKSASPSKGVIRANLNCAELAAELEEAGAAALSVLTEPFFFNGSLENLRTARANCALPLLRKDFIVDEYQILEARLAGASAILLIAALLDNSRLAELIAATHAASLEVLLEAHTEDELERALAMDADAIGVNARDLHTFKTSLDVVKKLICRIPKERTPVAESAIVQHSDIVELQDVGAVGFLMGEVLMRDGHPAQKLKELIS